MTDVVKQQVAAHWDRRAPTFDDDFGHSIRTPAERAAWDRILDLVVGGPRAKTALDLLKLSFSVKESRWNECFRQREFID